MRRIKKILPLLLCAAMLLCMCACSSQRTEDPLDDIISRKKITIGMDTTLPPIAFQDGETSIDGIAADLAGELASRLDAQLVIKPVSVVDAVEAVNNGDIDCFIGYPDLDFQTELLVNSISMEFERNFVIIVPAKSKAKRLYDLKGKKIAAVVRTDAMATLYNTSEFCSSLKEVLVMSDSDAVLSAIDDSTANAAAFEEAYIRFVLQRNPDKYKIIDQKLSNGKYYILFRKNADAVTERIDQLFSLIRSTGRFDEIIADWTGAKEPEVIDDAPLLTLSESDLLYCVSETDMTATDLKSPTDHISDADKTN